MSSKARIAWVGEEARRCEILAFPDMFDHECDEFRPCDFDLSELVERAVVEPLVAAKGHIHPHPAKSQLILGFIKTFSEYVMGPGSYGIENAKFPEAPLAHTAITFKSGKGVFL